MHLFSSKIKGKDTIIDNTIGFTFLNTIPSEITKCLEQGHPTMARWPYPPRQPWAARQVN